MFCKRPKFPFQTNAADCLNARPGVSGRRIAPALVRRNNAMILRLLVLSEVVACDGCFAHLLLTMTQWPFQD